MDKTKNWSVKKLLLFTLIICVIILFLIECVSRLIVKQRFSAYKTNLSIQANARWISSKNTIWTNRPFYLEDIRNGQYNEVGMRVKLGDVIMPKKGKDDFWVFLFGGSAMAGMGSNQTGDWIRITAAYNHPIEESIDGFLTKMLQATMKNKKVRVFNTAVSSHTIYQSAQRYIELQGYKPDWIVSMDLANEPTKLSKKETIVTYLKKEWAENPSQNSHLTKTTYRASHSAFYYLLSKYIYNFREKSRNKNIIDSVEYYKTKWLNNDIKSLKYMPISNEIDLAINSYKHTLAAFKKILCVKKQKHLLLIQPHISLRDTSKLKDTEKATYKYYCSLSEHEYQNTFIKKIYAETEHDTSFHQMKNMHTWDNAVFVDYCHFTKEANKKIANEIYNYIISNGKYSPFNK